MASTSRSRPPRLVAGERPRPRRAAAARAARAPTVSSTLDLGPPAPTRGRRSGRHGVARRRACDPADEPDARRARPSSAAATIARAAHEAGTAGGDRAASRSVTAWPTGGRLPASDADDVAPRPRRSARSSAARRRRRRPCRHRWRPHRPRRSAFTPRRTRCPRGRPSTVCRLPCSSTSRRTVAAEADEPLDLGVPAPRGRRAGRGGCGSSPSSAPAPRCSRMRRPWSRRRARRRGRRGGAATPAPSSAACPSTSTTSSSVAWPASSDAPDEGVDVLVDVARGRRPERRRGAWQSRAVDDDLDAGGRHGPI